MDCVILIPCIVTSAKGFSRKTIDRSGMSKRTATLCLLFAMPAPSATGRCGGGLMVLLDLLVARLRFGVDWCGWMDEAGVELEP